MHRWAHDRSLNQAMLNEALVFAQDIHAHQQRKNGDPYITHPIAVANILYEIGCGEQLIAVGLMHDTLEDALDPQAADDLLHQQFGEHIWRMVRSLTKDDNLPVEQVQERYFVQIAAAAHEDIGVLFVKIADLLHNLSTIEYFTAHKRQEWVGELRDGYLPILKAAYADMTPTYRKTYDRLMDRLSDYFVWYDQTFPV